MEAFYFSRTALLELGLNVNGLLFNKLALNNHKQINVPQASFHPGRSQSLSEHWLLWLSSCDAQ